MTGKWYSKNILRPEEKGNYFLIVRTEGQRFHILTAGGEKYDAGKTAAVSM